MAKQTSSTNKPQSVMAQLLAKQQQPLVGLKKGESVKGKLTKMTPKEILVDVGAKTEALVLEKEKKIMRNILSLFSVGDTVTVTVLNPESEYGHPVVSLRRYLSELAWEKLTAYEKSKEELTGEVQEVAKAGYILSTDFGMSGFLPQSHTLSGDIHVGQKIAVSILELNREDNKIIFSQRPTLSDEDFARVTKGLKEGTKVQATITNISSFGLFTTFTVKETALEGFIHISEVSWDKVNDLGVLFTVGQTVDAVMIRFDKETQRVNISIKRLTSDPFEELMKQYPLEKKVTGTIAAIDEAGVTVSLADDIEGFIKQEKIPPTTTYTVGQKITASVSEHDKKHHKLSLVPVLLEKPIGYR